MTEPVEETLRRAARLLAETPVRFAYLFGSHVTGTARPDSDVDVALLLDEHIRPDDYLEVTLELARALASASGLGNLDAVVLNDAPLTLRGRVLRSRVVLFSADEPGRVEYESRTLREFTDFDYHASRLDRELLGQIAAGER